MGVSAIKSFYLSQAQTQKIKSASKNSQFDINVKKSDNKQTEKNKIDKKIAAFYAGSALIVGAAIGSTIALKGRRWHIRRLEEHVFDLISQKENTAKSLKKYQKSVESLIDGTSSPAEIQERIFNIYKNKIKEPLDYNPVQPPILGKKQKIYVQDAINLPEQHIPTYYRANMQPLSIPDFHMGQRFDFELPMSNEVKITKMANGNFTPQPLHETTITESYADSVIWDNDKIARDIMQNFYDGHGQTIDGVKMSFMPVEKGKYKVRIEGKSTYTPDKAILLGESSKQNDAKAAGNFGEGLKITVLKILKDSGAENFKVGSDDWNVTWQFISGNLNNKRVLGYKLDKVNKFDGNYIEFETENKNLLLSLRKTINRFYHSHNTDFKNPDFENNILGIKILPENECGAFYIAGQRYQVSNSYDGLKGLTIFLKEKPPAKSKDKIIFDPSRDRTSLNNAHLKSIGNYITGECGLPKNDVVRIIHSMEKFWSTSEKYNPNECSLLSGFIEGASARNIYINFPDKYVARTWYDSPEMLESLQQSGYVICSKDFKLLGMQDINELLTRIRKHKPISPTEVQKQKIILIKEGVKSFTPYLENKYFNPEELDTKIYIFNKEASDESRYYEDTMAEAITDYANNGEIQSKGFWINQDYLDKGTFSEILGTALHELCHKYGGDESSSFSYKLTDILKELISSSIDDAKLRTELRQLQTLWDGLK